MGVACNEGALRSNLPCILKQRGGQHHAFVRKKIEDRALRACYLCGEFNGQPDAFESESMYHMLVESPHPSMALCRGRLKRDVFPLSRSDEVVLQSPLAFDQSEMWAVMLGTPWVSFPVQPPMLFPLQPARVTVHDCDSIIRAGGLATKAVGKVDGETAQLSQN